MKNQRIDKAWGGRFEHATDELMERFTASIDFDRKLLEVDVAGSMVYARALERAGVLELEELRRILDGLSQVREELSSPDYPLGPELEDIHMAVEHRLVEIVGALGGKLHTGRSRNDQVSLDERLYLRQAVGRLDRCVSAVQEVLLQSAEAHREVILPGYTHLQRAQPVLFAHYALSLLWMLDRDRHRLADAVRRGNLLPLGSGALAGTSFQLDREFMARELGFAGVTANSLDAVSDRDFLLEALSAASILMMHLSRYCEDLILWSSAEFGFIELADAFSTGSSMMPQKKNPDSMELIRGKTGRVYGSLMGLLTTMKGLPLTYAKDMQEDKEPLFDTLETVEICLTVFARAWQSMVIRSDRMAAAVDDYVLATDLADYLVGRGLPFREAHRVVAGLVRQAMAAERELSNFDLDELRRHSDLFDADALSWLSVEHSLGLRNIIGGTGPDAVDEQLVQAREVLASN